MSRSKGRVVVEAERRCVSDEPLVQTRLDLGFAKEQREIPNILIHFFSSSYETDDSCLHV